ncbi:MAG: hypothetical protein HY539_02310 [Deltaproteobacteria bacterium]|nr:hypothetical protein [Deltaproteobacteria bacterium]
MGKEVSIDPKKGQGWGGPKSVSYNVDTERTEAMRLTPSMGVAVGWMSQRQYEALGVQAIFDVGWDFFNNYQIERYPDQKINISDEDAKGLRLRSGMEVLMEAHRFGELGGPGLGVILGLYWTRGGNPIDLKPQNGLEAGIGVLTSF